MSFILIDDTHNQTVGGTKSFVSPVRLLTNSDVTLYAALRSSPSLASPWTLTFPTTPGTSGQFLQTDGSGTTTWATAGGGGGSPGGDNTAVQYNNSGSFGGANDVEYRKSLKILNIGYSSDNAITIDNSTIDGVVYSAAAIADAITSPVTGHLLTVTRSNTTSANASFITMSIGAEGSAAGNTSNGGKTMALEVHNYSNQIVAGIESNNATAFNANYGLWADAGNFGGVNHTATMIGAFAQAWGGDRADIGMLGKVALSSVSSSLAFGAGVIGQVAYTSSDPGPNTRSAGVIGAYGDYTGIDSQITRAAVIAFGPNDTNIDLFAAYIRGGGDGNAEAKITPRAGAAATQTNLWLWDGDNNALTQVLMGAANSGGSGFKMLRVAN